MGWGICFADKMNSTLPIWRSSFSKLTLRSSDEVIPPRGLVRIVTGDIAFRQHGAGHTTGPNWPTFLTFAERYVKVANPSAIK